jgi:hypothetical protein
VTRYKSCVIFRLTFLLGGGGQKPLQLARTSSFTRVSRTHITTHHSRWDSSGWVISSSQRPLPDNTHHSQQTSIHAPGGIRTQNLSTRFAADLHLRPRSQRYLQINFFLCVHILRWEIVWRNAPRIWRDFGSALQFQTRLTQTKPVLPLSNEHGSQVKD